MTNHPNDAERSDKLTRNLWDIAHTMRYISDGKAGQKRILLMLRDHGPMTQRELTQRLGVQPGSASEVIGKLENAGSILRTSSQSDHRTADIRLTDAGQEQAALAAQQREARHLAMFACLEDHEKIQLLALLEKINADWDQRYRQRKEK